MDEETAAERLKAILEEIAWAKRPCKLCRRELYFLRKRNGKTAIYTAAGVDHSEACPFTPKPPQRAPQPQERLFPAPAEAALDPSR